MSFKVIGTGSYVPPRIVENDELSTFLDTSDEWISERTGIRRRHVCTTETASELAYMAALAALDDAGVTPDGLDMILCATVSGEYISPPMSCMVQKRLGASCPAMDINTGCSAFVYMMDAAAGYFARGRVKRMLIVGAEQMSRVLDWDDRSTCVIFGDGAGALILEAGDNFLSSRLFSKGDNEVIKIPTSIGKSPFYQGEQEKPFVYMNGQETYKFAVNTLNNDIKNVISDAGLTEEDIAFVVPHQANKRIIEAVKKRMNIPGDRFCCNIENYGNTTAASIPLVIDELNKAGKLKPGDNLVIAAFGGGLSSAACVLRW